MSSNVITINDNISTLKNSFGINFDFIVVGAGVYGSSFATVQAKQGRKVLLIERDLGVPDRIVGELLQPGGYLALKEMGLIDAVKDIDGIDVKGYAVFFKGKPVQIPYTRDEENKQYTGVSFHHGRFIDGLRRLAKQEDGVTLLEGTVNKLLSNKDQSQILGVSCTNKETGEVENYFAPITVVADGCFSKFRKGIVQNEPETMSNFVGFILEDCPLPYQDHGHVVLTSNGPVLLYQIGSKDTRVLIDISGKLPNASNGDLKNFIMDRVYPELPENIKASFYNALNTQKPRSMPNSYLPPSSQRIQDGLIVGGDALNMRHPLTGGGMTVALRDVQLWSKILKEVNLSDTNQVRRKMDTFLTKRVKSSVVINILANALYMLFKGKNKNLHALQEGCFRYFELGGICIDGPVSFLSGINGDLLYLTYHFFRVCLYAQYIYILESSLYYRPIAAIESMKLFLTGCEVILPLIFKEFYPSIKNSIMRYLLPMLFMGVAFVFLKMF